MYEIIPLDHNDPVLKRHQLSLPVRGSLRGAPTLAELPALISRSLERKNPAHCMQTVIITFVQQTILLLSLS